MTAVFFKMTLDFDAARIILYGDGREADSSGAKRKAKRMEQNEGNGPPAEASRESRGCPCGCGGKGSNKLGVAIWVTLLLGGSSWFAYSRQKNSAEAERLLNEAYTLHAQGNVAASTELLRQSAELGNVWAQLYYGERLKNGFGTERNLSESVKWLRKAARQKCAEAYYQLGVSYENGEGVDRDLDEAEAWYRKALDDSGFAASAQSALDRIARLKSADGADAN